MKVAPIDAHFRANSYDYYLVESVKLSPRRIAAIYEQRHRIMGIVGVELHLLRLQEVSQKVAGVGRFATSTHYWRKPSKEDFGQYGWTLAGVKQARLKIEELKGRQNEL